MAEVEEEGADALEGFDEWEEFDPDRDEAPADYGFADDCTGEGEDD